jgi:dnd system-associated protein 4
MIGERIEDIKDWDNYPVYRNRRYEGIVDRFCVQINPITGKSIWTRGEELMLFAAMLGFTENKKEKVEKASKDRIQIFFSVYKNQKTTGYIYLLNLIEKNDTAKLKDSGLKEVIGAFEEYCNGGLSIIESWLSENLDDIDGTNTLYTKIHEQLEKISSTEEKKIRPPIF